MDHLSTYMLMGMVNTVKILFQRLEINLTRQGHPKCKVLCLKWQKSLNFRVILRGELDL